MDDMPYHYIMANLLARVDGAVAVLFVDANGETVEVASAEHPPEELRVVGAYLGLYLRHLGNLSLEGGLGKPQLIHFERGRLHTFAMALPDGYCLALLQRRPALAGRARARLAHAVEQMRRAVFHLPPS